MSSNAELAGEDGSIPFEVGDTIDAFVMSKKGGEIRLSKAISGIGGLAILQEALEKGVPIEGKVLEQVKGGYRVEVVKRRAFCPFSQMDLYRVEDPNIHVGRTYLFLITELEEDASNVIVSRRTLLEQERLAAKGGLLGTWRPVPCSRDGIGSCPTAPWWSSRKGSGHGARVRDELVQDPLPGHPPYRGKDRGQGRFRGGR